MQVRLRHGLIAAVTLLLSVNDPFALGQSTPSARAANSPQAVAHLVEKEIYVPAPQTSLLGLDALEVYFTLPGKHPLAVLTHGTSDDPQQRLHVTPWAQLQQALWFARRGYIAIVVVRAGYGRSGGKMDGTHGGCGSRMGSFEEAGEASADDLAAAMKYAQGLPEVEPGSIVSVGVSTGGFAQVALSANPPQGLKAAISFAGGRGGDGHEHNCNLDGLIDAFKSFGKAAHKHGDLPMLWIYSQNDHWFPPAMAQAFEAAYTKSGAVNQFVMAASDGEDGHHLYGHIAAWTDTVEAFLKAQNLLPLGDIVLPVPEPPNIPMPAGLKDADAELWRRFLLAAPYKTLVADERGRLWIQAAGFDQVLADDEAKDHCKKGGGNNCTIVARTQAVK